MVDGLSCPFKPGLLETLRRIIRLLHARKILEDLPRPLAVAAEVDEFPAHDGALGSALRVSHPDERDRQRRLVLVSRKILAQLHLLVIPCLGGQNTEMMPKVGGDGREVGRRYVELFANQ